MKWSQWGTYWQCALRAAFRKFISFPYLMIFICCCQSPWPPKETILPYHGRSVRPRPVVQDPASTGVYHTTSGNVLANSLRVFEWSVVSIFLHRELSLKWTPVSCITLWVKWFHYLSSYLKLTIICEKIHEYCVSFASEISFIWKSPWSIPKVLFLLTRYLTFINLVITFLCGFAFSVQIRLRWFNVTVHVLPNLNNGVCLVTNRYLSCQFYASILHESLLMIYNRGDWNYHSNIWTQVKKYIRMRTFA